jgi:hypothetical protein
MAKVTTGNVYNTEPVEELAQSLMVKIYADKDYLSKKLAANLFEKGATLVMIILKI